MNKVTSGNFIFAHNMLQITMLQITNNNMLQITMNNLLFCENLGFDA